LTGMNVSATIIMEQSENTLKIPVTALNRDGTVLITEDSPSAKNKVDNENTPEGYVYVKVEAGISDGKYAEIISGVTIEDTVVSKTVQYTSGADVSAGGTMTIPGTTTAPGGGSSGGMRPTGAGSTPPAR